MTKEEFVEMLTAMSTRSFEGIVAATSTHHHVGIDDVWSWSSMLENINGRLYVDDIDDVPTREGGESSIPMYALDEIDSWKPGLFEKLSGYIWWVPPNDEINLLDAIERATR